MQHDFNEIKRLHDMGFALLWLYPKSKRPIGLNWADGPRMSYTELHKIYIEKNQPYNIGVRLGEASKLPDGTYLCVLDCDVKSSDKVHLAEMEKALLGMCPASEFAPKVLSGRGGGSCHIYLRTPTPQISFKATRSAHKCKVYMPSVEPSKADAALTKEEIEQGYRMRLAWELDVFGNGKQVVIPPSEHPDTLKAYAWEQPLRDYEAIPLVNNLSPTKSVLSKPVVKVKLEYVDLFSTAISEADFDLIVSGKGLAEKFPSRSEALYAAIMSLIKAGLSDGQILSVLTDESNVLSEKPLSKGSVELASRWLAPQVAKIRSGLVAELRDTPIVDDLDEMINAQTDEEVADQDDEIYNWTDKLDHTKAGYKNTYKNLYLILKNLNETQSAEKCVFAFDQFNTANIYTFAPPWGDKSDIGRELVDLDDIKIRTWLSTVWGIEASETSIANVCTQLGNENSFHPVQRYLRSLSWDGIPRVNGWLIDYCDAEGDVKYIQAIGKKVLLGAIARVMHPGAKFDHVMILEGDQGAGKSTTVEILAGQWFTDSLGDIHSKDVVDVMRGKWIVEMGELSTLNKSDVADLKQFITRTHDSVRKAYGRRAQTYARQCIFIGTTNEEEYLKDATGARRFWPVRGNKFDTKRLREDRDQLWAEAFEMYKAGESNYLDDKELVETARLEQDARFVVDEIQSVIEKAAKGLEDQEDFTFNDIWSKVALDFGKPAAGACDQNLQNRIKKVLRKLGYIKSRRMVEGSRDYRWRKKIKIKK